MKMDIYFKLFHSIKQSDEIELARLEIEALVPCQGELEEIHSVTDLLRYGRFGDLVDSYPDSVDNAEQQMLTFQRYLEYQPSYRIQGFLLKDANLHSIEKLVRRLAYTREVYFLIDRKSIRRACRTLFPRGVIGANVIGFSGDGCTVLRAIVDQYYLEGTEYISKISSNMKKREDLDAFVERLKTHLVTGINRIPASSKARVGKRFLDYLSERQEGSRHLFHGIHPYKGKFHPKLARALLNIAHPESTGLVMDNFAGSGTLLIEAAFVGLDFIGVDINPQSVLLSRARTACFELKPESIDRAKSKLIRLIRSEIGRTNALDKGRLVLTESEFLPNQDDLDSIRGMSETTYHTFKTNGSIEHILTLRNIIISRFRKPVRDVLLLVLAVVISKGKHRKQLDAYSEYLASLDDISRRIYLYSSLRSFLQIQPGKGEVHACDAGDLQHLRLQNQVDAIVNSPPYSTAIDYIKNDLSQLVLLGLVTDSDDLELLNQRMGGNPRYMGDEIDAEATIDANTHGLPRYGIDIIQILHGSGRRSHAYRLHAFYALLSETISAEFSVLKPGGKAITVIGNNLLKLAEPAIRNNAIHFASGKRVIRYIRRENNVKSIDNIVVDEKLVDSYYGDNAPVRISNLNDARRKAHRGVYLDVENDRVLGLIATLRGFLLRTLIFRYLEKTRRGDIRLETIVVREKPSTKPQISDNVHQLEHNE